MRGHCRSYLLLRDDKPGDKFEVSLFVDLLLGIREDETATGLEARGGALPEGGCQGVHRLVQKNVVSLNVAAVVGLLVEQTAERWA